MVVAYGMWDLPGLGNLCPLHWQEDFYPLYHQGSPPRLFFFFNDMHAYYFIDHAIQHMGF